MNYKIHLKYNFKSSSWFKNQIYSIPTHFVYGKQRLV